MQTLERGSGRIAPQRPPERSRLSLVCGGGWRSGGLINGNRLSQIVPPFTRFVVSVEDDRLILTSEYVFVAEVHRPLLDVLLDGALPVDGGSGGRRRRPASSDLGVVVVVVVVGGR